MRNPWTITLWSAAGVLLLAGCGPDAEAEAIETCTDAVLLELASQGVTGPGVAFGGLLLDEFQGTPTLQGEDGVYSVTGLATDGQGGITEWACVAMDEGRTVHEVIQLEDGSL